LKQKDYININASSRIPKYIQVMDSIIKAINDKKLLMGDKIPSINAVSEMCNLSRDTVEKAYSLLRAQNIIVSVKGKGFYVTETNMSIELSVLFLINKLSSYKMRIYNAFVETLGNAIKVYQDFTNDIYTALDSGMEQLKKYKKIILVYPSKAIYPYPRGIVKGFKRFCVKNELEYEILDEIYDSMELQIKDLYIIIQEQDLVNLVKQARDRHFKLGEDIGIISYNDTPLKELLGITVISTDFKKMGTTAAKMILNKEAHTEKNDFNFINRFSA